MLIQHSLLYIIKFMATSLKYIHLFCIIKTRSSDILEDRDMNVYDYEQEFLIM